MTRARLFALVALCAFGLIVFFGDAFKHASEGDFEIQRAFVGGACEEDAVLLSESVEVFQNSSEEAFVELGSGSAIYLCEDEGQLQRIVFPGPGEKADCTTRIESWCSSGLVKPPFSYEILG